MLRWNPSGWLTDNTEDPVLAVIFDVVRVGTYYRFDVRSEFVEHSEMPA